MLVAIEVEMTLGLAQNTFGFLPDLGPYQLGLGTLFATTSPTTLASGQNLKAGVYTYVTGTDILGDVIADIISAVLNKAGGVFNTILKNFGVSVSAIVKALAPTSAIEKNEYGFMVNADEMTLLAAAIVGHINALIPGGSRVSIQCTFRYKGEKFSCKMDLGGITQLFIGLIQGATQVIKGAKEFFDETGKTIAFAEKQLGGFTDEALQTTANNINKGVTVVSGYANEAAAWAKKRKCGYQLVNDAKTCGTEVVTDTASCGSDYVTDAAKCGQQAITDAVKCGMDSVTSAAKCGTKTIESAAQCGMDTIKDGARSEYDMVKNCVASFGTNCKTAKSCQVPASCKIPLTCNVPKTCNIPKSCDWPRTCTVAKTCAIDNC